LAPRCGIVRKVCRRRGAVLACGLSRGEPAFGAGDHAAAHAWRLRGDEPLSLKLRLAALEARGKVFRTALRALPVQARLSAGLFLFLKLEGAAVPIVDLLLEASLDLLLDLVDLGQAARLDFGDMALRELDRRELHRGYLKLGGEPLFCEEVFDQ